jgi:Uma2 family endonuclease
MNLVLHEPWTVERFLAWEDKEEGRHEFDGGRIVEMTGGSRAHQRMVANLLRALEDALDLERWDAVQEMRLEVAGKVRYPDVSVVAGRVPDRVKTLKDATVLFEVLSDETADTDTGAKLAEYAQLLSIYRYVILAQDRQSASVFLMTNAGWQESTITEGALDLPELGAAIPLDAVYRGIRFGDRA